MEDLKKHRHKPHEKLVMYILIKEGIPLGHQVNCVGHAVAAVMKKWKDDPDLVEWIDSHFYKICLTVTEEQFNAFKIQPDYCLIREGNCDNAEITMGFRPRLKADYDPMFKTLKLFG